MMASSAQVLLLVLAAGCTPAAGPTFGTGGAPAPVWAVEGWYQDYFTATWEACGEPDEYLPWEPYADEYAGEPNTMLVTEACQEAPLADLKVDWDGWDSAITELTDVDLSSDPVWSAYGAYTSVLVLPLRKAATDVAQAPVAILTDADTWFHL